MDMTKYAGKGYIGLDAVPDGTVFRSTIAAVILGNYDKPVLELTSGRKFALNATNTKTLIEAWGPDTTHWVGEQVEFYPGTVPSKANDTLSVLARPIVRKAGEPKKPVPNAHADIDADIDDGMDRPVSFGDESEDPRPRWAR